MTRTWWHSAAVAMAIGCAAVAWADEPNEPPAPDETTEAHEPGESSSAPEGSAVPATESPAPPTPEDSADQTMRELMQLRQGRPVVEPARTPAGQAEPRPEPGAMPPGAAMPTVQVEVDRSVLGVAPGQPQPTLRREGDFVVSRRGRLVRSPDGAHLLFVFEADSKQSPEPPMILQENQQLEAMENIVDQRGGNVEFIVSGQVHTYRGANYLMVTMMQTALDQGNLQN